METREWNLFDATMVCEGNPEIAGIDPMTLTEDDMLSAWQYLIDTGAAWTLQGFFGRQASALIAAGYCTR